MGNQDLEINIGSVITLIEFERKKFVISSVHKGGMGIVYQLTPLDPFMNNVALKTYQSGISKEKFHREAEIWFSIGSHPHIAKAEWFGFWDGRPSILAEWYPVSAKDISISLWKTEEICKFIFGIIEGLNFAYEKSGVIHQDIKPDNILIDNENKPRISDFGVSALISDFHKDVGGTLGYIAPELFFWRRAINENRYLFIGCNCI